MSRESTSMYSKSQGSNLAQELPNYLEYQDEDIDV
jgi:hypothetical protein